MGNPLHAAARRAVQQSSAPRATAFHGATHSRLTEDWILASIRSADAEVKGDLRTLRKRSRELVRNTSLGARFQALVKDNVIGPHGIRLQALPKDPTGEPDSDAARAVEDAWKRWGSEPALCSADGKLSWHDVEDLHVETQAQDGESLLRMLPGFDNEFGFAVQVLDVDQLDEDFNRPAAQGKNEIRMGVEVNAWGRPVAYHVWSSHPFDFQGSHRRERVRIPAVQIVHRYQVRRAGQSRGVPWYAPILMDSRMLTAALEAELIASRQAAAKAGVFEQEASAVPDPNQPDGYADAFEWEMAPGVWDVLPPGLTAKFFDPTHPNAAFDAFSKIILRGVAAGLGTSYHSLTGDLTSVSFSSIRDGTLKERDVWRRLQEREATHTHRPIFLAWLRWALAMGQIDLPARELDRLKRHAWVPRGWPWVDPLKDAQAAAIDIRLGLDSRTRLAAERGRDFEEVLEEQAREAALAEKHGVRLSTDVSRTNRDDDDPDGHSSGSRIAAYLANGNGNGRHADS